MKKQFLSFLAATVFISSFSVCNVQAGLSDKELLNAVVTDIHENLIKLDQMNAVYQKAITDARAFVSHEITWGDFEDHVRIYKDELKQIEIETESDELKQETVMSDLFSESIIAGEFANDMKKSLIDNLENMGAVLASNKKNDEIFHENVCDTLIEIYETDLQLYLELFWYNANEYLLDVSDEKLIQNLRDGLNELPAFEDLSSNWTTDFAQLTAVQELCWTQLEGNVEKYDILIGDSTLSIADMKQSAETSKTEYIEYLMAKYEIDEETAEKYLELIDLEYELEIMKEDLREKFAPSPENNSAELIQKAAKFASCHMYEDAYSCLDIFHEKEEDPDCPYFCGQAITAFYLNCEKGSDYQNGILVTKLDENAVEGYYEAGDIIVKINENLMQSVENYKRTPAESGSSDQIIVIRMNEEQKLEEVVLDVPTDVNLPFDGLVL